MATLVRQANYQTGQPARRQTASDHRWHLQLSMLCNVQASADSMFDPSVTAAPARYVRDLWQMRSYAWAVGLSSTRASNSGTSLGMLWLFLEPIFSIATYWLVFGQILDLSRGVDNFLPFLIVGQVTFGLSQRAVLGASASLHSQAPMLRSLSLPRAVLPLAEVLKAAAAFRAEAVIMLLAIALLGEPPRLSWFLYPAIIVTQLITAYGLGTFLARLVYRFEDLQRLAVHLMRLALYASGVFIPIDQFITNRALLAAANLNPFFAQVELARWVLMGRTPASPTASLVSVALFTFVALPVGLLFFIRGERSYSGFRTR